MGGAKGRDAAGVKSRYTSVARNLRRVSAKINYFVLKYVQSS